MSKKRCKVKLWLIAILTLVGLFLTFVSFVIPTTNTTFNGFFNSINYGYDVSGGKLAMYEAYDDGLIGDELSSKLQNAVTKLNSSLGELGLYATKQGDQVRIEISESDYNNVEALYKNYQVDIFGLIGSEKGITFSSDSSTYNAEGYVDGADISESHYQYINGSWCVVINFTNSGTTKFKELTQKVADSADQKLYMYINGTSYGSGFEISNSISSLTLTATNQQTAEALALEISALAKPLNLKQVSNYVITPGLNTSTKAFLGNEKTLLLVALSLVFVSSLVFLVVRYRMFGVLTIMANLIFVVIYSFLLQSIPLVGMSFNGIMGVLLVYALLFSGEVEIFEKIRSEYALGKKIPNSVRSGFNKNVLTTLEKYVFGLVFCGVLYIVGSVGLKELAVNVFVGLFVNYLILFAILRGVCALYMPINSTNKKSFNLKREGKRNEI